LITVYCVLVVTAQNVQASTIEKLKGRNISKFGNIVDFALDYIKGSKKISFNRNSFNIGFLIITSYSENTEGKDPEQDNKDLQEDL